MKKKKKSRVNISESNKHRCEHNIIDIPHENISSDQRLNDDEFTDFD